MDHRLTPEENALIEDALTHLPLAPMPRDITAGVMARIQKDERPVLVTRNDLVIAGVVGICVLILFFTLRNLPPIMVMEIRKQSILAYQAFLVNVRWLVPSLSFGLAAFLAMLTTPYLWHEWTK